jgi:pyruvate dehydrogenase (quinone)
MAGQVVEARMTRLFVWPRSSRRRSATLPGLIGNETAYHAVRECDTLLLLGADFAWRQFYPNHAKIVQIDIEPTHLGRRHPVTRGLVGDIKATLEALIPRLHEKSGTHFRDAFVIIDRMAADDALVTGDDGTATV